MGELEDEGEELRWEGDDGLRKWTGSWEREVGQLGEQGGLGKGETVRRRARRRGLACRRPPASRVALAGGGSG